MITPEPRPLPCPFWTSICTTAGRTLPTTASRAVSPFELLSAGAFELACRLRALLLPNCQPANNPMPKTMASARARRRVALVRKPRRLKGDDFDEICCSEGGGEGLVKVSCSVFCMANLSFLDMLRSTHSHVQLL